MRKLAFVPVALLCMGAAPPSAAPSQPAAPSAATADASKSLRPQQGMPGEILLNAPAHCIDAEPRIASGQTLGPSRLDQLPPGNLTLTVMREVNGCPQPTTVREGIGGPAFRAAPAGR